MQHAVGVAFLKNFPIFFRCFFPIRSFLGLGKINKYGIHGIFYSPKTQQKKLCNENLKLLLYLEM